MDLVKAVSGKTPWYGPVRNFQHRLQAIFAVIQYGYPAQGLTVIGVTGTDGKTTTVHLIGAILKEAGFKIATISSLGAYFNNKTFDTGFHVTTPNSGDLQKLLRAVKNSGITHVVLEATSHGLDQHRVFGCNFKFGVLTNITHEHLDYHRTWDRYRDAKAKLFKGVKIAILNRDDASFDYIKNAAGGAKIISYGLTQHAMIVAHAVKIGKEGMDFVVRVNKKEFRFKTLLCGEYNVSNILAAAGAARGLDVPWDRITEAVSKFPGMPGRMEEVKNNKGFRTIVDFAHTPNALESLLRTLRKSTDEKVIVVFGSAGLRDREKRKLMGEVAARLADFSVLTAEDPRSESVENIIDDITRGIRQNAHVWDGVADWRKEGHWCIKVPERGEAIALAIQILARRGDIITVCGKGHERSMAYDHTEYPWSDIEATRVALGGGVMRVIQKSNIKD